MMPSFPLRADEELLSSARDMRHRDQERDGEIQRCAIRPDDPIGSGWLTSARRPDPRRGCPERNPVPWHSHSNVQDTFYKEGVSGQPTERRDSTWRKGLALSPRMDIAG